ncbi:MAG: nucleotide exchange factor GrpE [Candidatus Marinimicrobia bacterium]|nr:nucleotide exchange factor GrpE [Candidatus Neomarinimicrobiota bacterium]
MPKNNTIKKKVENKTSKKKMSKSNKKADEKSLEKEINILQDKHLRLKAEFENFRRRKADEISRLLQYDGENIISGFLPIVDDINRMINSKDTTEDLLKDGMKMVEAKIVKYFESIDVITFGEKGDMMDPDLHDAMLTQKDESAKDNTILDVYENGYTYRDKVIRHAKVIVNKK